jgi:hypothetical protein
MTAATPIATPTTALPSRIKTVTIQITSNPDKCGGLPTAGHSPIVNSSCSALIRTSEMLPSLCTTDTHSGSPPGRMTLLCGC